MDVSLYVCEQAADEFQMLQKAFREANDPQIYLEKKKLNYYNNFQKFCQGATSTAILGGLICSGLREPILRSAYNTTATNLAEDMKQNVPALNGNKSNIEKHILKSLAEAEEFDMYMIYIENPIRYFNYFISNKLKEYMSEVHPDNGLPRVLTMMREKLKELYLYILVIRAAKTASDKVSRKY